MAEEEGERQGMRDCPNHHPVPVGLRILIHGCDRKSNMVVNKKFMLMQKSKAIIMPSSSSSPNFLRACHLCKKQLSPNKDVYMYRGDQGFCSVECRCRQMFLDEMEEREDYLKDRRWRTNRRVGHRIKDSNRPRGIPAMA